MAIIRDTNNLMLVYALTRDELVVLPQFTSRMLQEVPFELMTEMEQIHLDAQKLRDRMLKLEPEIIEAFGRKVN